MRSIDARSRKKTFCAAAFVVSLMVGATTFFLSGGTSARESPAPTDPDLLSSLPARGKLLVASKTLADPRFRESVVLLIEYGSRGATGLIINRRTNVLLSTLLPSLPALKNQDHIVYYGGPVENYRVLMLVRSDLKPAEAVLVCEGVYVSSNWKTLEQALGRHQTEKEFRTYTGYAGWGTGQLAREVARGDWLIVPGDAASVFTKKTEQIWQELYRRGSAIQVHRHRALLLSGLRSPSLPALRHRPCSESVRTPS
jgi:putative transcriptional regulator